MYPNVMQIAVRKDAKINSLLILRAKHLQLVLLVVQPEINSRDLAEVFGLDYLRRKILNQSLLVSRSQQNY